jgi:hypothetical protein
LVGHKHETGAEDYGVKFLVGMVFLQVVEIHVLDLDVLVLLEQFLTSRNVVYININTQNLSVFEAMNDTF